MSSQPITPNTEAAILARLIQARDRMTPDVAQYLLSFDFDAEDTERMNSLAEKAREGNLMSEERPSLIATCISEVSFRSCSRRPVAF